MGRSPLLNVHSVLTLQDGFEEEFIEREVQDSGDVDGALGEDHLVPLLRLLLADLVREEQHGDQIDAADEELQEEDPRLERQRNHSNDAQNFDERG